MSSPSAEAPSTPNIFDAKDLSEAAHQARMVALNPTKEFLDGYVVTCVET